MDNDIKRLARLTAILIQFLSRRLVNSTTLAAKFGVSVRTIYRDIKTLERAGVPIVTEEGKGYSLVDGYKVPPIMLTETEANALLTAELIIQSSNDTSLIAEFASVTAKIKAILPNALKTKTEKLEKQMGVTNTYISESPKSNLLLQLQTPLLEHSVIQIKYTNKKGEQSIRDVEPFALYANQKNEWVLVAFCRLRHDFRSFSLINIDTLTSTNESFEPHKLTFEQYLIKTFGNKNG
ncbi:putative HTH-type transcriptional regulator yobV [Fibrella aestuarina BUZ 2]|uniref:Putative HTH-type transcriptional regulator yobV n=1 Tax=Fibrella aestuarina BUZ 2 TaxID=1166018 RepID=I0K8Z4_9BACT|nr:YafY family protein [Fibrella aestuarina]CCH00597.1 putative HTH-type transcriptional regulator yobV [Fibrella aestuarina BUZ 2]